MREWRQVQAARVSLSPAQVRASRGGVSMRQLPPLRGQYGRSDAGQPRNHINRARR